MEREPPLLAQLATWMRATEGPLDAMDGSFESLKPYWEWFISFCDEGLPGIPRDATPSMWDPSDPPPDVDWYERVWPVRYAAQSAEHYLRLVAARRNPPSDWTVYLDARSGAVNLDHHATGIALWEGRGATLVVSRLVGNLSRKVLAEPHQPLYLFADDIADARRPHRLFEAFSAMWGGTVAPQPRQHSLLAPLPDTATTGPFPARNAIIGPSDEPG